MRAFSILGTVVFLLFAAEARAEKDAVTPPEEEAFEFPAVRVGLGVALTSRPLVFLGDDAIAGSPASLANIQIPFYLGRSFRLEPEFGIFSQSGGLFPGNAILDSAVDLARVRTHVFRFLVGIAWATEVAPDTRIYLGPKVGLQSRSVEFESNEVRILDNKLKAVDFWIGAAVGGEAFLTRNFSLGVEAGFYYLNQGESSLQALEELFPDQPAFSSRSPWALSTQGSIAARIYFL